MKKFALILLSFCSISMATPSTTSMPATAAPSATVANTNPYSKYMVPSEPAINAKAYILIDANSGKVLAEKNADDRRQPASLTKLMSTYLVFKELAAGKIQLDNQVPISKKAWQTGGSKMFVKVGTTVAVSDLLQGVIVASGNDATVALAEYLAGTEDVFVQMMNQQAQALAMAATNYADATGLPNPQNYTTARDLSKLATHVVHDYPQYYHFFSEKWFTWNGIRQPNRNRLLWRNENVDGMKTGHTDDAGFCLIASAQQNGTRLIGVIMGAPSDSARANDNEALLKYGFHFFETHKIYSANQTVAQARVWSGDEKTVPIGVLQDFYATVPNGAFKDLMLTTVVNTNTQAPVKKGQQLGVVNLVLNGQTIQSVPLVALQDDEKGGVFRRFFDWIHSKF